MTAVFLPQAFRTEGRPEVLRCVICGAATRHGKPWCPEHVLASPYVQGVTLRISSLLSAIRLGYPTTVLIDEVARVTRARVALARRDTARTTAGHIARAIYDPRPSEDLVVRAWDALGYSWEQTSRGVYVLLGLG